MSSNCFSPRSTHFKDNVHHVGVQSFHAGSPCLKAKVYSIDIHGLFRKCGLRGLQGVKYGSLRLVLPILDCLGFSTAPGPAMPRTPNSRTKMPSKYDIH